MKNCGELYLPRGEIPVSTNVPLKPKGTLQKKEGSGSGGGEEGCGGDRSGRGVPTPPPNSLTRASSGNHLSASPLHYPSKFPVATQMSNLLIFPHQSSSL